MSHTVEYDPEEKIVIATFMGDTNLRDLQECLANIIRVAKRENCAYILSDLREANLQVSVMQTYHLPDTVHEAISEEGISLQRLKRAFVGAKDQDILQFYETVSVNHGEYTKLFHDLEEAKSWLKQGRKKPSMINSTFIDG